MREVTRPTAATASGAVPLAARVGFTLWMMVWVPVVLATQGPQNFWWLCNPGNL